MEAPKPRATRGLCGGSLRGKEGPDWGALLLFSVFIKQACKAYKKNTRTPSLTSTASVAERLRPKIPGSISLQGQLFVWPTFKWRDSHVIILVLSSYKYFSKSY